MSELREVYIVYEQPSGAIARVGETEPKVVSGQTYVHYTATSGIADAIERARVVGVLDAFVSRHALIACHVVVWGTDGGQAVYMCELRDAAGNVLDWRGGDDADAARAAAAKAIESGEV